MKDATMPTLEQQVIEILADVLLVDETQATPKALLGEDLGMDSLDLVEICLKLEEDLLDERQIGDAAASAWLTVEDVVATILKAKGRAK